MLFIKEINKYYLGEGTVIYVFIKRWGKLFFLSWKMLKLHNTLLLQKHIQTLWSQNTVKKYINLGI